MAANVRVKWTLPAQRPFGSPIAGARIEISADGGANYGTLDTFPPAVSETVVQDLEPGDWFFRGTVLDEAGRESKPAVASIRVVDDAPPGELTLELSLA